MTKNILLEVVRSFLCILPIMVNTFWYLLQILVLAFVGCAVAQILPYSPVGGFVPAQGGGKQVQILRQSQDVNFDGNYQYR